MCSGPRLKRPPLRAANCFVRPTFVCINMFFINLRVAAILNNVTGGYWKWSVLGEILALCSWCIGLDDLDTADHMRSCQRAYVSSKSSLAIWGRGLFLVHIQTMLMNCGVLCIMYKAFAFQWIFVIIITLIPRSLSFMSLMLVACVDAFTCVELYLVCLSILHI